MTTEPRSRPLLHPARKRSVRSTVGYSIAESDQHWLARQQIVEDFYNDVFAPEEPVDQTPALYVVVGTDPR